VTVLSLIVLSLNSYSSLALVETFEPGYGDRGEGVKVTVRSRSSLVVSPQMPTVFSKNGFRFFFYSNDHRPIHIHVRKGQGEAVFTVEREVELRESVGLKTRDLREAEALAREHRFLIIRKWNEHLD